MTTPRVLDLSVDLSGMYATRLLADQGWDVRRVDIPQQSRLWEKLNTAGVPQTNLGLIDHHLNRNKRRLQIDLFDPTERGQLAELVRSVDFIVESFPAATPSDARLSFADFQGMNPKATVVSISPYGRTGPYSNRLATDRTLWAHSGAMFLCGRLDERPLAPNVPIVSFLGGVYACIAILSEQIRRARTGGSESKGRHFDISLMDSMSANLERATTYYSYLQSVPLRGSASRRYFGGYPAGPYRAKDGYLMLVPGHQPVSSVALLIERPELIEHPLFTDRPMRIREAAAFDALIEGPLLERDVDDLVRDAADLRMPCARILEMPDLLDDEQLAYRKAFVRNPSGELEIQEPWRFLDPPLLPGDSNESGAAVEAKTSSPTPLGQPTGGPPLAGMRVLDLTQAYAGPTASRILAELGAEVIKVESVDHLDVVPRGLIPCDNEPGAEWWERSGFFADRNLGKLGVTLKLDHPEGRQLALDLVKKSDVAIWNYSPRVMDNLGLSFASLREANPGIVLTAMSGYGYSGPGRNQYALAASMEAASGWTSQIRYRDGETPMLLGFSLLDALSGIYAATATLFALERRIRTGSSSIVDFAARESAIPFLAFPLAELAKGGSPSVEHEFLSANGRHLTLQVKGEERWVEVFVPESRTQVLMAVLAKSARGAPAGERHVQEAGPLAREWDQQALVKALQENALPAAAVFDGEQILLNDHLNVRRLFHLVDRPTGVGIRPHARQVPGLADGMPLSLELGPPPRVGQHNRMIFSELLGLSDDAIEKLAESGVIGEGPAGNLPAAWRRPLPLEEMAERGAIRLVTDAPQRMRARFGVPIGRPPAGGDLR